MGDGDLQQAADLEVAFEQDADDLYENAPCGYVSTLPDWTIVKANATFLRWTGYAREDLIGRKRLPELLTVGGRIYHETHYAPMVQMQGFAREVAVDFIRPAGDRMSALINSIAKTAADGTPVVIRTTVFDATERRRYEAELLRERVRARESEERARTLAQTLQASFIPPEPAQIPGLDVAAVFRPSGTGEIVGGDFFDVFETRRRDWVVMVGDVSGKGPEAAKVTVAARYALRAAAVRSARPRVVLSSCNDALLSQGFDRFCTVLYARVRRTEDRFRMTVGTGGHPLPLMVSEDGGVRSIGRYGTILGVIEDPSLHDAATEIQRGSVVVFFTDGLTEGRGASGEFYGDDRLVTLLRRVRGGSAAEIAEALVGDVVAFQDGLPRDDIAVVVLKRPAGPV